MRRLYPLARLQHILLPLKDAKPSRIELAPEPYPVLIERDLVYSKAFIRKQLVWEIQQKKSTRTELSNMTQEPLRHFQEGLARLSQATMDDILKDLLQRSLICRVRGLHPKTLGLEALLSYDFRRRLGHSSHSEIVGVGLLEKRGAVCGSLLMLLVDGGRARGCVML